MSTTTCDVTRVTVEERRRVGLLMAETACDHRTALKALREGPGAIRVASIREALARAMVRLGIDPEAR
ncbi:MAG TPA: hypothetical protein VKU41_27750 [Polyangiaceae bacterium]|nr:hypothetical protein [Polyangiaceae bacterium]